MRILTFGTFDHFHPGHHSYLSQAKQRGDLFVIIARDAHVKEIKGRAPDQNEAERLQGVKEAFPDAEVLLGDAEDYLVPIRELKPDLLFLGYDQTLPPGVDARQISCPIERAEAFESEVHKSSLRRE